MQEKNILPEPIFMSKNFEEQNLDPFKEYSSLGNKIKDMHSYFRRKKEMLRMKKEAKYKSKEKIIQSEVINRYKMIVSYVITD